MTATARASPGFLNSSAFYSQWIKTFWISYNCNFDDEECYRDAVVDWKAYSINQDGGVEVWLEDIV